MNSFTTASFWKAHGTLSPEVKVQVKKAYKLWQENLFHPSLHFKKVTKTLWSVRISGGFRALALKKGEDYYWIWIGTHDEYERLIN